jgi:hypothetical protein
LFATEFELPNAAAKLLMECKLPVSQQRLRPSSLLHNTKRESDILDDVLIISINWKQCVRFHSELQQTTYIKVESILPAARICAVHEARRGLALPDLQVPPLQNFAALRVVFSARKRHFCARGRGLPEDDDEDVEATETKPPEVESGGAAIAAITISSFITCM